ncbi:MAG: DNA-3-methyladenine glycosylase 2 family protein [Candidatus Levybacteria bacterium]|nr:DNA-3-methyladenine glycosylase 2 family protein [Candidatus Levybacteria bacterium]
MEENSLYKRAITHLEKQDPILADVIAKIPPLEKRVVGGNYFLDLIETIISQQLSIKAADTIWGRFQSLFPKKGITPEAVTQMDTERIRTAGISYQKISYIKDLAKQVAESGLVFEQFDIMTDEEIITELVKVKGIGQWTAEMLLMFNMGRPDVFSYGDLGIRKAIQRLYNFKKEPTQKQAEKIAKKWRPYRTIACRYLWKSLELA